MKPIDYRNATWEEVQKYISGMRRRVYDAWLMYGPGTTEAISRRSEISILTFRPRSTELYQMGLLRVATESEISNLKSEMDTDGGVYIAVPEIEAETLFNRRQANLAEQPELALQNFAQEAV